MPDTNYYFMQHGTNSPSSKHWLSSMVCQG